MYVYMDVWMCVCINPSIDVWNGPCNACSSCNAQHKINKAHMCVRMNVCVCVCMCVCVGILVYAFYVRAMCTC